MRRFALACAFFIGITVPAVSWDMNYTIDQTNFVVNTGCSGTLIDAKQRLILTASHCVTDQYETAEREKVDDKGIVTKERYRRLIPGTVRQKLFDGANEVAEFAYRTKLVAVDNVADLAVLEVVAGIRNRYSSPIACKDPSRGDYVWIVGNPAGILYSSIVAGMVSSVQRTNGTINLSNEDRALIQVSGGIVGGNSGGAVYSVSGELVGVPVLGHRVNEVLGFAVPASLVRKFLKEKNITITGDNCG